MNLKIDTNPVIRGLCLLLPIWTLYCIPYIIAREWNVDHRLDKEALRRLRKFRGLDCLPRKRACCKPTGLKNGTIYVNDVPSVYSTATWVCDYGFRVDTEEQIVTQKVLTCLPGNTWSHLPLPRCYPYFCIAPKPPRHGYLVGHQKLVPPNTYIIFRCHKGYRLKSRGSFKCSAATDEPDIDSNGTMPTQSDLPRCVRDDNYCEKPTNFTNGIVYGEEMTYTGGYVNFACRTRGYRIYSNPRLQCVKGNWIVPYDGNVYELKQLPYCSRKGPLHKDDQCTPRLPNIDKVVYAGCDEYHRETEEKSRRKASRKKSRKKKTRTRKKKKKRKRKKVKKRTKNRRTTSRKSKKPAKKTYNRRTKRPKTTKPRTYSRSRNSQGSRNYYKAPDNGQIRSYTFLPAMKGFHAEMVSGVSVKVRGGPQCLNLREPNTCCRPRYFEDGTIHVPKNPKINQTATFICNRGYMMFGGGQRTTLVKSLTCKSNYKWSERFPKCKYYSCDRPPDPENGFILQEEYFFPVDTFLTVVCHEGYVMHGQSDLLCKHANRFDAEMPRCLPANNTTG